MTQQKLNFFFHKFGRIALFLSLFFLPLRSFAQDAAATLISETKRDITIVGASGIGGAVLGLSTLSFVEEPTKNLKNILIGGAIGIIVGVGVVAYLQGTKSKDSYEGYSLNSPVMPSVGKQTSLFSRLGRKNQLASLREANTALKSTGVTKEQLSNLGPTWEVLVPVFSF